jgi:hypothetical protein
VTLDEILAQLLARRARLTISADTLQPDLLAVEIEQPVSGVGMIASIEHCRASQVDRAIHNGFTDIDEGIAEGKHSP